MVLISINPVDLSEETSFSYYENIAKSKKNNKRRLLYGTSFKNQPFEPSSLYEKVRVKYHTYDENINNLEQLVQDIYESEEKVALQHCYTSPTAPLRKLKSKIINSQQGFYQNKCAYCGLNEKSDMDHYVPKEKFPEYSVHPLNLIPICSICNGKKSNYFIEENKRIFFNPYSDRINKTVLTLEINYNESSNSFLFTIHVDEDFLFKSHIDKLCIVSRYEEAAISVFDTLKFEVMNSFENLIDIIDDFPHLEEKIRNPLEKTREYKLKTQGINSLEFLVYDAFLKSEYFDIVFLVNNFGNDIQREKLAIFT